MLSKLAGMSKTDYGAGGVYQRGKTWWVHYPTGSGTIRESAHTRDEKAARKVLRTKLGGSGPTSKISVSELLDDLLLDYEIKRKTLWWAKMNVENHLRPFFKYYKAAKVKPKLIESYILQKRAEKLADSTINRHLALLRRSFKLGVKNEKNVPAFPAIEKLDESAGVRQGFLEYGDFKKLRDELPEEIRPVEIYAYYTGCRRGEILKLQWHQIDLDARMVRLRASETKGREARTIPLADEVHESLSKLKVERDRWWPQSPWVFTRGGKRIKDFRKSWKDACTRAGVGDALLHDNRRSGVRNLVRAGVPESVAMKISGHRTRSVFDRYNITSEQDLGEAMKKVQTHLKRKKK